MQIVLLQAGRQQRPNLGMGKVPKQLVRPLLSDGHLKSPGSDCAPLLRGQCVELQDEAHVSEALQELVAVLVHLGQTRPDSLAFCRRSEGVSPVGSKP